MSSMAVPERVETTIATPPSQSLLSALSSRDNGLNAVRLVLAAGVLLAHSWPLSGHGDGPRWGGETLGSVAVSGFFAISGYLIASSRVKLPFPRFLWNRFLRIFPGYWVMLVGTAFVAAPLVSWLADESWSPGAGLRHILLNVTTWRSEMAVPGTLLHTPFAMGPQGADWNGSAWTLSCEILCYLAIGIAFSFLWVRRHVWVTAAGLVGASVLPLLNDPGTSGLDLLLSLAAPFAAGALLRMFGPRVPVRGDLALVALAWAVCAISMSVLQEVGSLPLAYLMLYWGARWRPRVGQRNDLSYGIYIYAFPVQQILADLGIGTGSVVAFAALAMAGTLPLALLSWHVVEKRALCAKSWQPPRLLPPWPAAPDRQAPNSPESDTSRAVAPTGDLVGEG